MRIVAGGAGETVTALAFTGALLQGLPLARRATARPYGVLMNEAYYVVGDFVAGLEVIKGVTGAIYAHLRLEMALQAD